METFAESVDKLAKWTNDVGMTAPATFLLEAHKPLLPIAYNLSLFFSPLLCPFISKEKIRFLETLFSDKENVDLLISKINKWSIQTQQS